MPLELISGRKGRPQLQTLLSVHELVVLTDCERRRTLATSVIVMSVCYSQGDLWIAELAERFVVYEDTHSSY